MKYVVREMQNVTACSVKIRGPTNRVLSEEMFDTEEEAEAHYNSKKAMLRFAGLAGQYCSFPTEVDDNYQPRTETQLQREYDEACEESTEHDEPYYEDEY